MNTVDSKTLGWEYDTRYSLAHVSRIVAIGEWGGSVVDGFKHCRIIPLCHGVQSRNGVRRADAPKPLAELLATPVRATWKPCGKCFQIAKELAAEEQAR